MKPRVVTHDGAAVVGVEIRTSNADESRPASARIPALWQRFYAEGILDKIPGKTTPAVPLGVYTDYEGDEAARYRLLAGAAVEERTPTPPGLGRALIPADRYLLFQAEGDMPKVVIDTWTAIWEYFAKSPGHVRAFTTDFELYRGPKTVEIYIAVKLPAGRRRR
jgi:predicted transcriptional regulator YdeE